MDSLKLKELKQLEKVASPIPWVYNSKEIIGSNRDGDLPDVIVGRWPDNYDLRLDIEDAELIAQSRNALPDMLSHIELLETERDAAVELFKEILTESINKKLDDKIIQFLNTSFDL